MAHLATTSISQLDRILAPETKQPWSWLVQLPEIPVSLEVSDVDSYPITTAWRLPLLSRNDQTGKTRIYTAWYHPYHQKVYTLTGTLEDSQRNVIHDVDLKSAQSMQGQAYIVARDYWRKAERKNSYQAEQSLSTTLTFGLQEQMSGFNLRIRIQKEQEKALKSGKPFKYPIQRWPVGFQFKQDGVRGTISYLNAQTVEIYSRQNKVYTAVPHINKAALSFFKFLPNDIRPEGEIIADGMSLQVLSGYMRRIQLDDPMMYHLQFRIFDLQFPGYPTRKERGERLIMGLPMEERYNIYISALRNWYASLPDQSYIDSDGLPVASKQFPIITGLSMWLAWSPDEIDGYMEYALALKQEGGIVRRLAGSCVKPVDFHPPQQARYYMLIAQIKKWYQGLSKLNQQEPETVKLWQSLDQGPQQVIPLVQAHSVLQQLLASYIQYLYSIPDSINTDLKYQIEHCLLAKYTDSSWNKSQYVNKRADHYFKVKPLQDDEGYLVRVLEGGGANTGMAGSIELSYFSPVAQQRVLFKAGMTGTESYRQQLWHYWNSVTGKNNLVNKLVTFEFIGYTDNGIPQYAKFKAFRDYE